MLQKQITIQSRKKKIYSTTEAASNIVTIEVKFQDILKELPSTYTFSERNNKIRRNDQTSIVYVPHVTINVIELSSGHHLQLMQFIRVSFGIQ